MDETFALGQRIGTQLTGGEVLLLNGPLGAGKTVFVKGLASAFGVDPDEVSSPSFTLVNPYVGRFPLFHLDLYRLDEGAAAANAVDLEELLTNERAVIVIEWAERLGRYPLKRGAVDNYNCGRRRSATTNLNFQNTQLTARLPATTSLETADFLTPLA